MGEVKCAFHRKKELKNNAMGMILFIEPKKNRGVPLETKKN